MDDITDADYKHAKTVKKDFNRKYLGKHYDLYVQSITLLLTDVFEAFAGSAAKYLNLIKINIYQHQDWHGRHA